MLPDQTHIGQEAMTATTFRLRADLPHGILPESFAMVSAAVPADLRAVRGLPADLLADALRIKEWPHFPAELIVPGETEPRITFGVVHNLSPVLKVAREFHRPGVFWVSRGRVEQFHLNGESPIRLLDWDKLTGDSPATLHGIGNFALAGQSATAFLCSTQCPAAKAVDALEWARRQCDEGTTIISGFHTPVEQDVLAILARRGANLIWVPGRDIPKTMDATFRQPMQENRLLVLSPFAYGNPSRPSTESCGLRNRFVLGFAKDRYLPHGADGMNDAPGFSPN